MRIATQFYFTIPQREADNQQRRPRTTALELVRFSVPPGLNRKEKFPHPRGFTLNPAKMRKLMHRLNLMA